MQGNHLVLTMAVLGYMTAPTSAEPDYCKRGMWLSDAYRHCFEEQRFNLPYLPLQQVTSVVDGCMMEDYARHVCQVVKPAALSCFEGAINRCDDKDRLMTIADHSGGACDGIQVNGEFKKHVLNFLLPVRADSGCFSEQLDDATNECLENGVDMMERENAKLQLLKVDKFIVANNIFFDRVFTCFIDVYRSNMAACRNWQIPLLLQLQSTAIPSLFGMTFTPEQMGKLELSSQSNRRPCPQPPLRQNRKETDKKSSNLKTSLDHLLSQRRNH